MLEIQKGRLVSFGADSPPMLEAEGDDILFELFVGAHTFEGSKGILRIQPPNTLSASQTYKANAEKRVTGIEPATFSLEARENGSRTASGMQESRSKGSNCCGVNGNLFTQTA